MWPFRDKKKESPKVEAIKALTLIELNVVQYYQLVEGLLNTIENNIKRGSSYQLGLDKVAKGHETNELILRELVEQIEALKGKR